MNKVILLGISLLSLLSTSLWAGGPWLIYSTKEAGPERSLLFINLEDQQYAFNETEDDEDTWIHYNPSTKKVFRKIYLIRNEWHRLTWARSGKSFFVIYSQFENRTGNGVSDHGSALGTGSMVSWPNRGRSIGINGSFPASLNFTYLQIGGGWSGDRLTTGTRVASMIRWIGTLEIALTKALNDARADLATNQEAKDFIIDYFTAPARGYTQTADVEL